MQLCDRKPTRAVLAPAPSTPARIVHFNDGPVWADWANAGKIPFAVAGLFEGQQGD